MKKYLLGFDIGTEGSKGIILDTNGNQLAYDYIGHDIERTHPGWAEHDGDKVWWNDFVTVVKNLLARSQVDPKEIAGISCSGVAPGLLPVGEDGVPLRKGMLYGIDTRGTEEVEQMTRDFGEEKFYKLCYARPSVQFVGPKIMWIKKHEPDVFAKAAMYHTTTSYVTYKLTGNNVISNDLANQYMPFYDFEGRTWSEEMCRYVGITSDMLPSLMTADSIAGEVTEAAHRETGLAAGTPVAAGTGDFDAELMSMCPKKGDTLMLYGSTFVVNSLVGERMYNPDLFFIEYPIHNLYTLIGATSTSASITKWFRNNFGAAELAAERAGGENAYEALANQAGKIRPGSDGLILLPYFAGERSPIWDEKARGMFFGLTLGHTKAHMYRAVLEGVAYSVQHQLEEMRRIGLNVTRITAAGGGSQNRVWTQIVSDVTGCEQTCIPKGIGSPAGDACLAGLATGVIKDDGFLRDKVEKGSRRVIPDMKKTEQYKDYFEIYKDLYTNTKDLMHRLSRCGR